MINEIIDGIKLIGKKFKVQEDGSLIEIKDTFEPFTPKIGDTFWYPEADGRSKCCHYDDSDQCQFIVANNFIFKTQQECESYYWFKVSLNKYAFKPDWNSDEKKFYIIYDHEDRKIIVGEAIFQQNIPYFKSPEDAFRFVDEAGEKNVERFLCNIWK